MTFITFRKGWNLKEGDQIGELCQDRIKIKRVCGKVGIWDYDGKNIIPDQKQKIKSITIEDNENSIKKVFIIKKTNGKYEFYDHDGKEFEVGEVDEYEVYRKTCIVGKGGQKGVISFKTRKTIIPVRFEKVENMYHHGYNSKYGEIYKVYKNGKCGCFFEKAGLILPVEFDDWNWREGEENFDVSNNNLHGVYDFKGKEIVPVRFLPEITSKFKALDEPNEFMRIYIVSSEEGKGLYSETGKNLIPVEYDEIDDSNDLKPGFPFVVKKDKLYEMYDLEGTNILDKKYDQICTSEITGEKNSKVYTPFLFIKFNQLWGFFSIYSKKFVEPQFDAVKWDKDYGLFVRKGDLEGLYSVEGNRILEVKYENIVKENIYNIPERKWGSYLKLKTTNGLYGIYHRNKLYEPEFKEVSMLHDSITDLYVVKNGHSGIYSSIGRMIVEPECDEIKKLSIKDSDKVIKVYVFKEVNMYGFYFYDEKLNQVIESQFIRFEATIDESDGKLQIIAENDETTVIIDENGKVNNSRTEIV